MKLFITFLFISTIILAEKTPLMLQIDSDLKIPEDFRNGIEAGLIKKNYSLLNMKLQEDTLKEQNSKNDCIDDSCLIDTGRMLAAKNLIVVKVTLKNKDSYKFNARFIDLETGAMEKSLTVYYEGSLLDYQKLLTFGSKLIISLIDGKKTGLIYGKEKPDFSVNYALISLKGESFYSFFDTKYKFIPILALNIKAVRLEYKSFYTEILGLKSGLGQNSFRNLGINIVTAGVNLFNFIIAADITIEKLYNENDIFISYGGLLLQYNFNLKQNVYIASYFNAKATKVNLKGDNIGMAINAGISVNIGF